MTPEIVKLQAKAKAGDVQAAVLLLRWNNPENI